MFPQIAYLLMMVKILASQIVDLSSQINSGGGGGGSSGGSGVLGGTVDPVAPPPDPTVDWLYINRTSKVIFQWNPDTATWV